MENRGHAQCWCNLSRFPTTPPAWGALFKTRPVWGAAPPLGCRAIQCKVASSFRAAVSLQGATQNRKRSTLATSPGMRVWRSKPGEVLSATLFHNASCPPFAGFVLLGRPACHSAVEGNQADLRGDAPSDADRQFYWRPVREQNHLCFTFQQQPESPRITCPTEWPAQPSPAQPSPSWMDMSRRDGPKEISHTSLLD